MPVPVAAVRTFWEAYARLPESAQDLVSGFLSKFKELGPTHNSFRYKDMEGAVDPNIREIRVNRNYRVVALHPSKGNPTFLMLWVNKHDEGLEWPKYKRFVLDPEEHVHIFDTRFMSGGSKDFKNLPPPAKSDLLATMSDDDLMNAGISRFLLPSVRAIDDGDDFSLFLDTLSAPVANRLFTLYAYGSLDAARPHLTALDEPGPPAMAMTQVVDDVDDVTRTVELLRRLTAEQRQELLRSPLWDGMLTLPTRPEAAELPSAPTEEAPEPSTPRTRRLDLVVLDPAQQRFAKSIDEGPRLLKGVAGSGKTLVLVSLAMFKAMQGVPRVLITCYNLALTRYISSLLDANLNPLHRSRIEVRSIFELCGDLLNVTVRHENEKQPYYDGLVTDALKAVRKLDGVYDAVLVDETQDLSLDMIKLTVAVTKGKKPDIKFAEDTNQNIFDRRPKGFTWKSVVGVSMRGRTTILRTSRRSTWQICDAADRLAGAPLSHTVEDEDGQTMFLQREDRSGAEVEEHAFTTPEALSLWALERIESLVAQGVPLAEIAVLYTRSLTDKNARDSGIPFECLEHIETGLESRITPVVTSSDKRNLDILENKVKMGSVYAFKGLDFEAVFLLDGLGAAGRKGTLLFVGATRAREYLHVLTLDERAAVVAPAEAEGSAEPEAPAAAETRSPATASRAKPRTATGVARKKPMAPPIRGKSPKRR